jgi:hypothetical protein
MNSLYLNNTELSRFCNFADSLRRSQNKEISFPFSVGSSPYPSTENLIVRKFLCFGCRVERGSEARQTPMRTEKHKATTRAVRCSYGLFSKWVRPKASTSSQNETSSRHNKRGEAAQKETEAKTPRRSATNWDGTGAAKRADLSLFRI